jgi:predicted lipoprotein
MVATRGGLRAVALTALGLQLAGCPSSTPGTGPGNAGESDRRPLLKSLGEHVVLPTLRHFVTDAGALHAATDEWVNALGAGNEGDKREAARAAWRAAMSTWQQAELMQLGPAAPSGRSTGGQSLRDELYSWPTVNPCRVDQELVADRFESPGFFDTGLVNTYGLVALEYLLFHDGPQNSCPPQVIINTQGSWAQLSSTELRARRARYARAAAGYLVTRAQVLRDAWEPSKGNFVAQLAGLGKTGVEEVFTAMFYLDQVVKDDKLAVPAGLHTSCMADSCPDALESRWAGHSGQNLVANLRGFRRLLLGNDHDEEARPGFDDWLAERGAPEVADSMVRDLDAATARLLAIEDLRAATVNDVEKVREVHAEVKKVTDLLKSQFAAALGLRVPSEGAADND